MNAHLPAPRSKWPGWLVNLAVVLLVLALAAAAFVLSYAGVHAIALQAGVSAQPARLYPGVFDAVLVIACVAALMLRDARWGARLYAWLVIIAVVAVVGAADAVHAMNVALPHRTMEGVVAAAPLVLVLLGFSLMLTIFRPSLAQHAGDAAPASHTADRQADQTPPLAPADLAAELAAGQPASAEPGFSADYEPTAAVTIIPMPEQPIPDTAQATTTAEAAAETGVSASPAEARLAYADSGAPPFATASFAAIPRLNRIRSTPTPPEDRDE
jgi:hypothetical protein